MDLPSTLIPLTHVQEERALRAEVTKAFHTAIPGGRSGPDEEDQEEDDFLVTKDKIVVDDEQARKYREFLLEQAGGEEGVREILGMGSFPERMIDADVDEGVKGEDDGVKLEDGEEEKKKKVRTKDDDEEFLMKWVSPLLLFPRHPMFSSVYLPTPSATSSTEDGSIRTIQQRQAQPRRNPKNGPSLSLNKRESTRISLGERWMTRMTLMTRPRSLRILIISDSRSRECRGGFVGWRQ
jgi:hypothetical protein